MKYCILFTILALTPTSPIRAESPFEREFKQLREQRDKTVAAAVEPINRKYQASLDQLLRRATQGNDLETALKIKEAMTQVSPGAATSAAPSSDATTQRLAKKLEDTKWYYPNTVHPVAKQCIEFLKDGKLRVWNNAVLADAWRVTAENTVEIQPWTDHSIETVVFDSALAGATLKKGKDETKIARLRK